MVCKSAHDMGAQDLADIIRARLRDTGRSAASASRAATGQADAIARIFRGHEPRWSRVVGLCQALGLELYVGPPREATPSVKTPKYSDPMVVREVSYLPLPPDLERHTQGLVRAVWDAGGYPIPADLSVALMRQLQRRVGLVTVPLASNVALAAGSGEAVWDESVEMMVVMALPALASWALPDRLICARVAGDSMTPTIRDGDLAAIDRSQTDLLEGQVFALRTDEGVVVKRLRRIDDRWHMASDNPAYEPRPVTGDDRILGRVAWTGPPAPGRSTDGRG